MNPSPPSPMQPMEREHPFEPGELLDDRFRVIREVARGGMGIVYEAFDEKLERRIAIKCAQAAHRRRLPREVRNASDVSHPNVCKLFEIHTASTSHGEVDFLTMEFLEGETLAARLRSGPLPRAQAEAIALQICAGLAEAHRDNVIHGDLKSGNIILTTTADGAMRAVITDFGLALRPTAGTGAAGPNKHGEGTPDYMAPELWRGASATVASDVYALGVILCELFSGRRPAELPLGSAAATATIRPGLREMRFPRKPPPMNHKWRRVISRCIDPDPARRFQRANEIARALLPLSRRWFVSAAAAFAIAILTGAFVYQRAGSPPEAVRLAVLPFAAPPALSSVANNIAHDAASQIAQMKGRSRTRVSIISPLDIRKNKIDSVSSARAALGATHVLHGTLEADGDKLTLRAYVTDARSGANAGNFQPVYAPEQLRYAGGALASVVSEALHLPPLASVVNAAGRNYYLAGVKHLRFDTEIDAALDSLQKAVAADPDSPRTYAELSRAQWIKYSMTTQKLWLERAAESLRQAELRHPDLPEVHNMAGVLKANAGWYEQAAVEYRRTIEIDPSNGEAYRRLGSVYEHNNQVDEELAVLRKAVEVDPQLYRNHQNLGAFFFQRARYTEAAEHFKRAVDLVPREPYPHFSLAVAYLNLGRFREAEQESRVSIGLQETPKALHTLGQVLMYQDKDQHAVPFLQRALSLDPRRYVIWSHLGIACRRMKRPVEETRANRRGLELCEQEIVQNPRNVDARSHLAYLCVRLGDRVRGESEIAQALSQLPNDADTRWMAVMTYEALGRRESALAVLNSAPKEMLADLNRWPDASDLRRDRRFSDLLARHQIK